MTQRDKELIKEFCIQNLDTHTDWTGTRVETKYKCGSIDEFINRMVDYIEEQQIT